LWFAPQRADDSAYASMWQSYKIMYGKAYGSMDQDYEAFSTWKKSMNQILDTNIEFTDLDYWVGTSCWCR
jgi:hypothetical protein